MKKESIRKKIDDLKVDADKILGSDYLNNEVRLFIKSMLTIIDIIVALLLEKKTRKNSSNSGLPPSRNNGPNGNRNNPDGGHTSLKTHARWRAHPQSRLVIM